MGRFPLIIKDKPYMHLNLPISINPNWQEVLKNHVGNDNFDENKRITFRDINCTLLPKQIHMMFENDFKIKPTFGLLWSWPSWVESDKIYHVDFYGARGELNPNIRFTFAINLLIKGSRSITEFVSLENSKQVPAEEVEKIRDKEEKSTGYRGTNQVVFYDTTPDWSSSIMPNYPMMINVGVPHRVCLSYKGDTRWSYSIRFNHMDSSQVSWQQAVDIFKKYEID